MNEKCFSCSSDFDYVESEICVVFHLLVVVLHLVIFIFCLCGVFACFSHVCGCFVSSRSFIVSLLFCVFVVCWCLFVWSDSEVIRGQFNNPFLETGRLIKFSAMTDCFYLFWHWKVLNCISKLLKWSFFIIGISTTLKKQSCADFSECFLKEHKLTWMTHTNSLSFFFCRSVLSGRSTKLPSLSLWPATRDPTRWLVCVEASAVGSGCDDGPSRLSCTRRWVRGWRVVEPVVAAAHADGERWIRRMLEFLEMSVEPVVHRYVELKRSLNIELVECKTEIWPEESVDLFSWFDLKFWSRVHFLFSSSVCRAESFIIFLFSSPARPEEMARCLLMRERTTGSWRGRETNEERQKRGEGEEYVVEEELLCVRQRWKWRWWRWYRDAGDVDTSHHDVHRSQ